ncbi:MAG: hypothetical protein WDZ28_00370 [Simkaniaceae bacterium]
MGKGEKTLRIFMSFAKLSACFFLISTLLGVDTPAEAPSKAGPGCEYPKTEEGHTLFVSINIHGGRMLELSDNSVWLISPDDVETSASWLSDIPIEIGSSGDPNYSCLLTNTLTESSVKARQVKHI